MFSMGTGLLYLQFLARTCQVGASIRISIAVHARITSPTCRPAASADEPWLMASTTQKPFGAFIGSSGSEPAPHSSKINPRGRGASVLTSRYVPNGITGRNTTCSSTTVPSPFEMGSSRRNGFEVAAPSMAFGRACLCMIGQADVWETKHMADIKDNVCAIIFPMIYPGKLL